MHTVKRSRPWSPFAARVCKWSSFDFSHSYWEEHQTDDFIQSQVFVESLYLFGLVHKSVLSWMCCKISLVLVLTSLAGFWTAANSKNQHVLRPPPLGPDCTLTRCFKKKSIFGLYITPVAGPQVTWVGSIFGNYFLHLYKGPFRWVCFWWIRLDSLASSKLPLASAIWPFPHWTLTAAGAPVSCILAL